jgi:hypothetical protein
MYKLLVSILCIITVSFNVNSQTTDSTKIIRKHQVGMHQSSLGGIGLSYRYWPKKLGVQATVLPIFQQGQGHFLSAAVSLLYTLKEAKNVDLYGYWGNHYISTQNYGNSVNALSTGLGMGFKINFTESLNFNIQAGYGFYNITESYTSTIAGGIGLYYAL